MQWQLPQFVSQFSRFDRNRYTRVGAVALPANRSARVMVIACGCIAVVILYSVVIASLVHHDGVRGFSTDIASGSSKIIDKLTPGCSTEDRARLEEYARLEEESKAYIVNHARCNPRISDALRALDARWGRTALDMSVAHEASGLRVRKVMQKLLNGEKVVIAALGGSITFGHSLEKGGKTWPIHLGEMLKETFPEADISVTNNAVPATGSDYFAACYQHHIPADPDLFLLEFAVNDMIIESSARHELDTIWHSEHMARAILKRKNEPAIIYMSTWQRPQHYITGADQHATISEYYDIPRISSRAFLYPYMVQHTDEIKDHYVPSDRFSHQNNKGQKYMADIMLRYLLSQACRVMQEQVPGSTIESLQPVHNVQAPLAGFDGSELLSPYDPWSLPKLRVRQDIMDENYVTDAEPYCSSIRVREKDGSTNGKAQLQPVENNGYVEHFWNDKWFYKSEKAGSTIKFGNVKVTDGTISLYYLRSGGNKLGNLRCWAGDDPTKNKVLPGQWGFVSIGARALVAKDLKPGTYSVSCKSEPGAERNDGQPRAETTMIIAVMAS